jgi:hypothetical protein
LESGIVFLFERRGGIAVEQTPRARVAAVYRSETRLVNKALPMMVIAIEHRLGRLEIT